MTSYVRLLAAALLLAVPAAAQQITPSQVRTGLPLPAISGVDLEGNPADLTPYLGRGSVVLSFWSIHCTDCIRELDDLRSIRREFPEDQVTVVAVNTDSGLPISRIAGFLRRYEAARGPLSVVHLLDRDEAIVAGLGVRYIPLLLVTDPGGRVSSVLTGYAPEDRDRVVRAMEEGRVALGAWGEGLRGRLRTVLRGPGPGGRSLEWGSFRVEEGMALFGLYDSRGWLADAAGRRDRGPEAERVVAVVEERLRTALLQEALASVGVRLPRPDRSPYQPQGLEVPEGPLAAGGPWEKLYRDLGFDELYRRDEVASLWVGDTYWAGFVGDVDLGALRERLAGLGFPAGGANRILLETASDFDFKARALVSRLSATSYRLQAVQGNHLVYFGNAEALSRELASLTGLPFQVFVEVADPTTVRVEVF